MSQNECTITTSNETRSTDSPNSKKVCILDCGGTICCERINDQYHPSEGLIYKFINENMNHLIEHIDYKLVETFDSSDIDYPRYIRIIRAVETAISDGYRGVVITHGTDTLAFTGAMLTFAFPFVPIPVVLTASQIPLIEPMTDGRGNLFGSIIVAFGNNSLITAQSPVSYHRDWLLPEVMVFMTHHLFLASRIMKYNATEVQSFVQRDEDRIGMFIHKFVCDPERDLGITWRSVLQGVRLFYFLDQEGDSMTRPLTKYQAHKRISKAEATNESERKIIHQENVLPPVSKLKVLKTRKFQFYEHLLASSKPLKAIPGFTPVGVIRLFPGINESVLNATADISAVHGDGLRCAVISAFGSGNGPTLVRNWVIANQTTTFVVVCTQCPAGRVTPDYATSLASDVTPDGKVIPLQNVALCDDLTLEAAVGKLANYFYYFTRQDVYEYILPHVAHELPCGPSIFSVLKHQMERSHRGELTGRDK